MRLILTGLVTLGCAVTAARAADPLVIHEWGTFTSLQDEDGRTVAGINSDDEPVPHFVHNAAPFLLVPGKGVAPVFAQGAPRCHPGVTMRLETPVIYFHPPGGAPLDASVNVGVAFRGGWLTQYFPNAMAAAPGLDDGRGSLDESVTGRLDWEQLRVGTGGAGPKTDAHVWLAPRDVKAADVTTRKGQSERFLFYRGVGHVESPLRAVRRGSRLELTASVLIKKAWLVEIRVDGACAFAELPEFSPDAPEPASATLPQETDCDAANLGELRASMRRALVADGLFEDEAEAMLKTWELSYFKSDGLRVFFIVPRQWTDGVLPLTVSVPAKVARVMVGRVELVTPRHRELLAAIAKGPASDTRWWYDNISPQGILNSPHAPPDYRAFEALGRFRNALVLDEALRRPTPALGKFIRNYSLHAHSPPPTTSPSPASSDR